MNQMEFSIPLGRQREEESGRRAARTASGTLRASIHLLLQESYVCECLGSFSSPISRVGEDLATGKELLSC